jgi:hypothetical protein
MNGRSVDEDNPSPQDAIADGFGMAYGTDGEVEVREYWSEGAERSLSSLKAAGLVVVRDSSGLLNHGDELMRVERAAWDDGVVQNLAWNRYPDGAPMWRRVGVS